MVVPAAFGNVDLPRLRPDAVGRFDREQPDGRPEPVALGKLGDNLDAAVLDCASFDGVNAAGLHGWDDGGIRGVCRCNAVRPDGRGANALLAEVDNVVVRDQIDVL